MRAWQFHEFGPIANLRLEEVPMPVAGSGEVILAVRCAALNPADRYMVAGQYPRPAPRPFAVGRDAAGVIHQALPGGRFREGDAAVVLCSDLGVSRMGTLAEFVAVPEACLAPLPAGWSFQEGAAAPLVFLTAWQALFDRGGLEAGETLLVTGASGGVGTAAIILAKARGARVVAASRSMAKAEALRRLGADIVVDGPAEQLAERVKDALDGGRADMVLDNLGGPYLEAGARIVRNEGRIVVTGLLAGVDAALPLGLLIHKCIMVRGMSVSAYRPDEAGLAWNGITAALESSGQGPVLDELFPFSEVPLAFARLASGPLGKVCIQVS